MAVDEPGKILEDFNGEETERLAIFCVLCSEITGIAFNPMKIVQSDNQNDAHCVCNGKDEGDMVLCENPQCSRDLCFTWNETARYRLKYCLKGPLSPKQPTNQPTKFTWNV